MTTPKITPFLWFNGNAEEAVEFYLSVFPGSKKTGGLPGPDGKPLTISFELGESAFTALNGGPNFSFNKAISFVVPCDTQEEIDYYWEALTAGGGQPVQCGWLDDRFGLSWQIVPSNIAGLLSHPQSHGSNDEDDEVHHCRSRGCSGPASLSRCRST